MACSALNPCPAAQQYRRQPGEVMRLSRMGSFHSTRLSFLRSLLRRLRNEAWTFQRLAWNIDASGVGDAIYTVHGAERSYSLVCFAHDLPDDMRSDRVIATAWDATFTLYDGIPSAADIERLRRNVPLQEAGRISARELTLARANRSVRLFEHTLNRLANGQQPDLSLIEAVGYLMRTTAVYGSGKFGAADRSRIATRVELRGPFRAEMLTVWLIRAFTLDLVEHLARVRGGHRAVTVHPTLRRRFGVGNSTGLGMAPFLINHPVLLNNWMLAREEALARVRAQRAATAETIDDFFDALSAARDNAAHWTSTHPVQQHKLAQLNDDLAALARHCTHDAFAVDHPWDAVWRWSQQTLSEEGQEALVSLLLEPHGTLVDGLADCMDADEQAAFRIDGSMSTHALADLVCTRYAWALEPDYRQPTACARFWYVSAEKLEPRLGERHSEPGAEYEQPLGIGRDVKSLALELDSWAGPPNVAAFLSAHPEHRHTVRRCQVSVDHPFAEIQDNLLGADLLPIDLLRCKLSFFGATRFDPRSDRWVRISLFQHAPYPHELLGSRS